MYNYSKLTSKDQKCDLMVCTLKPIYLLFGQVFITNWKILITCLGLLCHAIPVHIVALTGVFPYQLCAFLPVNPYSLWFHYWCEVHYFGHFFWGPYCIFLTLSHLWFTKCRTRGTYYINKVMAWIVHKITMRNDINIYQIMQQVL